MLNPYSIISQARDKKKENLQWIERNTELYKNFEPSVPNRKSQRMSFVRRAIEIMKSLILLKWPALGHK